MFSGRKFRYTSFRCFKSDNNTKTDLVSCKSWNDESELPIYIKEEFFGILSKTINAYSVFFIVNWLFEMHWAKIGYAPELYIYFYFSYLSIDVYFVILYTLHKWCYWFVVKYIWSYSQKFTLANYLNKIYPIGVDTDEPLSFFNSYFIIQKNQCYNF